ncbi:ChrR family anti-sigma-E factor [Devosia sp. ZB163]|uniref:ChrR family anti-sigma-E factor n=1 Tax=Devosia sp. ZB163 TaxID=3025938 RepID=UPI0023607FF5|nr:ChrR family anti-sigma-E factor [Devosia sp. ZB163]MDC9825788.1 ChrR family anti-sigma-E factor [Devosia sp. ZB163]
MMPQHHLSEDLLLAYAAGNLSEGWTIAVASHLAFCPQCRAQSAQADMLGGAMLDTIDPEPLANDAWSAMRARLDADVQLAKALPARATAPGKLVLPMPLRAYVGGDIDTIHWRALGRGAAQMMLPTSDPTTQVRLLRIPAGKPVPEHSHGGREVTLVLSGSFRDGEQLFGPGDIEDADGSVLHTPTATPEADCICLAVTDAPLRFSSWIVRLIQPILKI